MSSRNKRRTEGTLARERQSGERRKGIHFAAIKFFPPPHPNQPLARSRLLSPSPIFSPPPPPRCRVHKRGEGRSENKSAADALQSFPILKSPIENPGFFSGEKKRGGNRIGLGVKLQ